MQANFLDLSIIALCLLTFTNGVIKGFIRDFASMTGIVLGFFAVAHYGQFVSSQIKKMISFPYPDILSFVFILSIIFILCMVIGIIVRKFLHISMLGWLDRILGGVFGLFKGLVLAALLVIVINYAIPRAKFFKHSYIASPILKTASHMMDNSYLKRIQKWK